MSVDVTLDLFSSLTYLYYVFYARLTRLLVSQNVVNVSMSEGMEWESKKENIGRKVQSLSKNILHSSYLFC